MVSCRPAEAALFRAPRGVAELFFAGSVALLISLVTAGSVEVLSALALMGVGVQIYGVIRMRRALGSPVSKW
jgi:hypothetical protein